MNTFLRLLPMELSTISEEDYITPSEELGFEPRDHYVGKATESMKQMYTLYLRKEQAAEEAKLKIRFARGVGEGQSLQSQYAESKAKARVLRLLFWITIQDEFDLWDKQSVGIRSNWDVVWTDPDPDPDIADFFRRFLDD